jgi:hypothetical protein
MPPALQGVVGAVILLGAAGVYQHMLQSIIASSVRTEQNLIVSTLLFPRAFCQVFESGFLTVSSPRVGEYCIRWDVATQFLSYAKIAIAFVL